MLTPSNCRQITPVSLVSHLADGALDHLANLGGGQERRVMGGDVFNGAGSNLRQVQLVSHLG